MCAPALAALFKPQQRQRSRPLPAAASRPFPQIVPRLAEGGMQRAAYLSGEVDDTAMAKGMHQAFPWARVLVTLREPISRAVALLSRGGSAWCLNE